MFVEIACISRVTSTKVEKKKKNKFFCLLNNLRAKKFKVFILHIIRLILTKDQKRSAIK